MPGKTRFLYRGQVNSYPLAKPTLERFCAQDAACFTKGHLILVIALSLEDKISPRPSTPRTQPKSLGRENVSHNKFCQHFKCGVIIKILYGNVRPSIYLSESCVWVLLLALLAASLRSLSVARLRQRITNGTQLAGEGCSPNCDESATFRVVRQAEDVPDGTVPCNLVSSVNDFKIWFCLERINP